MSDYRVLARQYRPQNFDDLVGQDVLVRTLRNAIESKRIAHAFVLTGIRGIGKTTTARIMAKALNCLGKDGAADGPTIHPCGVCTNCEQIRDDRHVDVLEMDAASRTGVNDVREIIDSIYYKPTSSRYKIYIIDEAHMLSNSAFNALLKTLEEPPAHVIFIFATTEIRKIPVTILSRCQRFDLRRLNTEEMTEHLRNIAAKEQVMCDDEALALMAIASEGSVRDALSLMDQAIAHSDSSDDTPTVSAAMVRGLLGLVDRSRLYHMMEHLFKGECTEALSLLGEHYGDGANMVTLLQDMLQAVHVISRLLIAPNYQLDHSYAEHEQTLLRAMAQKLSVPTTTKAWQLLLKGLEEVKLAPDALAATEMLFIRFAYSASLPDPAELVKQWQSGGQPATHAGQGASGGHSGGAAMQAQPRAGTALAHAVATQPEDTEPTQAAHLSLVAQNDTIQIEQFAGIIALCEREREAVLLHQLTHVARLIRCSRGELVLANAAPLKADAMNSLKQLLATHTDQDWQIRYADAQGENTIAQQRDAQMQRDIEDARTTHVVAAILEQFSDATITTLQPTSKDDTL